MVQSVICYHIKVSPMQNHLLINPKYMLQLNKMLTLSLPGVFLVKTQFLVYLSNSKLARQLC